MTMLATLGIAPAMRSKLLLRSSQSRRLSGDTAPRGAAAVRSNTATTRSGSGKGRGRNSVASTSAKIAAFAPMPSASVAIASTANAGCWRRLRTA